MRLAAIHIENFRCLRSADIEIGPATVLVGANGTGKSSVLHALNWFFAGGTLELDDVTGHEQGLTTSVTAVFRDFDKADRDALGKYVEGDAATFERRWSEDGGERLTGRSRALPAFETVRAEPSAGPQRSAYQRFREDHPEFGLPNVTSAQAAMDAMNEWEVGNPEALESSSTSATHLFGAVGSARLAGRFDYVLIPAVAQVDKEVRDGRGTLLRQLLDRFISVRPEVRAQLADVAADARDRANEIIRQEGYTELASLAKGLTSDLQRLVPGAEVRLQPIPVDLPVPSASIGLTITDAGLETQVDHQGHGVQRSLFMAMVQQLAAPRAPEGDGVSAPRLLLAIEEPELFQHPLQARHLAKTLSRLAGDDTGIQVVYATHSEHFVSLADFTAIRRFHRDGSQGPAISSITQATVARVAARLDGVVARDEIATRVRIALARGLEQAVFARGVVIVEGRTDAAILEGLAEREGEGLDASGIAIVPAGGKTRLLLPWAVLEELGVPTFVLFDGDSGLGERLRAKGQSADVVDRNVADTCRLNEQILRVLGDDRPELIPGTRVRATFACFQDELEAELAAWDDFTVQHARILDELGDYREKSEDAYRTAARVAAGPVPATFERILTAARGLTASRAMPQPTGR